MHSLRSTNAYSRITLQNTYYQKKGDERDAQVMYPHVALQIKLLTSSCGDTALELIHHSKHQLLCLML